MAAQSRCTVILLSQFSPKGLKSITLYKSWKPSCSVPVFPLLSIPFFHFSLQVIFSCFIWCYRKQGFLKYVVYLSLYIFTCILWAFPRRSLICSQKVSLCWKKRKMGGLFVKTLYIEWDDLLKASSLALVLALIHPSVGGHLLLSYFNFFFVTVANVSLFSVLLAIWKDQNPKVYGSCMVNVLAPVSSIWTSHSLEHTGSFQSKPSVAEEEGWVAARHPTGPLLSFIPPPPPSPRNSASGGKSMWCLFLKAAKEALEV